VILIVVLALSVGVALWMGKYPPLSLPDRRRFGYGMAAVVVGSATAWLITVIFPTS
jgi:uncharacterized membrane protein